MMDASKDNGMRKGVKGLCLFSGGLDSMLAVCVLREQGIMVEGIVFSSPFFKLEPAYAGAEQLDLTLHVCDFTRDILDLVEKPAHGFGGALNPCIDCHARMIQRAGEKMECEGFDFVATGEVLNQRPMSQNRRALGMVEKDADLGGRLLRPLSARLLSPTLPEDQGLVDRERLLDLNGRSRKPQLALARQYGLKKFPAPAGGCLLTESGFCRKLADLRNHTGFADERLVWLLLHGRHFRMPDGSKCIVGRDATDNNELKKLRLPEDTLLHTVDIPGPTVLLLQSDDPAAQQAAAELCAAYAGNRGVERATVRIHSGDVVREVSLAPPARERFLSWML